MIKKIFGLFSLSAAIFIFEACYGHPGEFGFEEVQVRGYVKAKTTNEPIREIKVIVDYNEVELLTDENGYFSCWLMQSSSHHIQFLDVDGTANGSFENYEATINNEQLLPAVDLDILLEEK